MWTVHFLQVVEVNIWKEVADIARPAFLYNGKVFSKDATPA